MAIYPDRSGAGHLRSMAGDVQQAKTSRSVNPQTPWSTIRSRSLHPSVGEHVEAAQGNLEAAKSMRAEHHGAVLSALGGGTPEAMAGPATQSKNDEEMMNPAGDALDRLTFTAHERSRGYGTRYGNWQRSISSVLSDDPQG